MNVETRDESTTEYALYVTNTQTHTPASLFLSLNSIHSPAVTYSLTVTKTINLIAVNCEYIILQKRNNN